MIDLCLRITGICIGILDFRFVLILLSRVRTFGPESRYSVPFFSNGNHDYQVVSIQGPERGETNVHQRYEPITVGEHIRRRIRDTHVDLEKERPKADK